MSKERRWSISNSKSPGQSHLFKRPAFQDDIVNEEFNFINKGEEEKNQGRLGSNIQLHLRRKEKLAGDVKKKKPRKPKAAGHMSVLDQIELLEHQENEDKSPSRSPPTKHLSGGLENLNLKSIKEVSPKVLDGETSSKTIIEKKTPTLNESYEFADFVKEI